MTKQYYQDIVLILSVVILASCTSPPTLTSSPTSVSATPIVTGSALTNPLPTSTRSATATNPPHTTVPSTQEVETDPNQDSSSAMETNRMEIQIGDHILTATLVENSSTDALKAALSEGPITIDMRDYGSMEKVGSLGMDLPRNDEQITTEAGPVNFSALFKQITCLALLITADPERGAIVTDEDVAELRKSISHLQVKHIPGAGHSIRREQFSKYMESVNTFIAETR